LSTADNSKYRKGGTIRFLTLSIDDDAQIQSLLVRFPDRAHYKGLCTDLATFSVFKWDFHLLNEFAQERAREKEISRVLKRPQIAIRKEFQRIREYLNIWEARPNLGG
jgi:hypothetical protein